MPAGRIIGGGCWSGTWLPHPRRPSPALPAPDELWDALVSLSYRQRAVLVLKFYEDMAELDIAAALGCRPGTVTSIPAGRSTS